MYRPRGPWNNECPPASRFFKAGRLRYYCNETNASLRKPFTPDIIVVDCGIGGWVAAFCLSHQLTRLLRIFRTRVLIYIGAGKPCKCIDVMEI